jgi:uncharacterized protein
MMVRIVDRRFDSRNKSSSTAAASSAASRGRSARRWPTPSPSAAFATWKRREDRHSRQGHQRAQFRHGKGGVRESGASGQRPLLERRPDGPSPGRAARRQGSGRPARTAKGLDDFVFTLTRDEFLDIFFDELALPNLVKRQLARIDDYKRVRAGYTQTGVPTNINLVRTMRGAPAGAWPSAAPTPPAARAAARTGRRRSTKRRRTKPPRSSACSARSPSCGPDRGDSLHRPVRSALQQPHPRAAADHAGGDVLRDGRLRLDGRRTEADRQALLHAALPVPDRNYEHIEVVFIRHHTVAEEVDEDDFFHSREPAAPWCPAR